MSNKFLRIFCSTGLLFLLTACPATDKEGEEKKSNSQSDQQQVKNTVPVLNDYYVTTSEDVELNVNVPAVDTDKDPLTYLLVQDPTNGQITSPSAGNYTYTPNLHFHGSDQFQVKVNDGKADSNTATIYITVNHVNHAPVAANVNGSGLQGGSVVLNVVSSASDIDTGDVLHVSTYSQGNNGSVYLNTSGNLVYSPNFTFFGTDTFTFRLADGANVQSNVATATVSITHVNHAPQANAMSKTLNEDTILNINLTGSDIDNDPITYSIASGYLPSHGTLSGTPPNVVYTPVANYYGIDSFKFIVTDNSGLSSTAQVSLTIYGTNDAPIATNQQFTLLSGTQMSFNLNAYDPDNQSLTYQIISSPSHGNLTGIGGNKTYSSTSGYFGNDSFTYKVIDPTNLESQVATVTFTLTQPGTLQINGGSNFDFGTVEVHKNSTQSLTLTNIGTTNVTNIFALFPESNPIYPNNPFYFPGGYPGGGNCGLSLAPNSSCIIKVKYAPEFSGNNSGLVKINYTSSGQGAIAQINLTGTAVYPAALSFSLSSYDFSLQNLGSSTDVVFTVYNSSGGSAATQISASNLSSPFSYKGGSYPGVGGTCLDYLAAGSNCTVVVNFFPSTSGSFNTNLTISYRSIPGSSTVLSTSLSLAGVGALPANLQLYNLTSPVSFGAVNTLNVSTKVIYIINAGDRPATSISVSGVQTPFRFKGGNYPGTGANCEYWIPAGTYCYMIVEFAPTVTGNYQNTLVFNYNNGIENTVFNSTIFSGSGLNPAPIASNRSVSGNEDSNITGTFSATDVNSPQLTYSIVSNGSKGTVTITNATTGTFTYVPNPNVNGTDSFTYKANDGESDSNIATVSIAIYPVNDPPVITQAELSLSVNENSSANLNLANAATDVDGGGYYFYTDTNPTKGTAAMQPGGLSLIYTPNPGMNGDDIFTVRVADGYSYGGSVNIRVSIQPANHPPVAYDNAIAVYDSAIEGRLSGAAHEGQSINFSILSQPSKGSVEITDDLRGIFVYTPSAGSSGTDNFTFKVTNAQGDSNTATETIYFYEPGCTLNGFGAAGKVTFTDSGSFPVNSLYDLQSFSVLQADSKIVMLGHGYGSSQDIVLARYNCLGVKDTSFNSTGSIITSVSQHMYDAPPISLSVQNDFKPVVAIPIANYNGGNITGYYKFFSSGPLQTYSGTLYQNNASGPNTPAVGFGALPQLDRKILIGGRYSAGEGVARFLETGYLDTAFGISGIVTLPQGFVSYSATIQRDDKILIAGTKDGKFAVVRLNHNGTLDTTFANAGIATIPMTGTNIEVRKIAVQKNDRILLFGQQSNSTQRDFLLARLNNNGTIDSSFNGGSVLSIDVQGDDAVSDLALQNDGKILAGGTCIDSSNSIHDFCLVRLNTNGSVDSSFGLNSKVLVDFVGGQDQLSGVAVEPDGKILLTGVMRTVSYTSQKLFAMARLKETGQLDAPPAGVNDLTISGTSFTAATQIPVSFHTNSPYSTAWIGTYLPGAPNSNFVTRNNTGGSPSGTVSIRLPTPAITTTYELRLFWSSDTSTLAATSSAFTVVPSTINTLTFNGSVFHAGDPIAVNFTTNETFLYSYVELILANAIYDSSYVSYLYMNGQSSGILNFTAPSTPGTYEFRMIGYGWPILSRSTPFTVVP